MKRGGWFLAPSKAAAIVPNPSSANIPKISHRSSRQSSSTEAVSNTTISSRARNRSIQRQPTVGPRVPPLNPREAHRQSRGKVDIWMLGLTIVIGGQYFSWNAGLAAGFYSYLLAFLVTASGYITLCLCTAEISGALPFAGGAYGLSRCTLGFYPGFIIGCCEALEYIAYVSTTVILFVDLLADAMPVLRGWQPLLWLLFYGSALAIQLAGGRVFWGFNLAIGTVSLGIVLVFVLGAVPFVDYEAHVARDPHAGFVGGVHGFMQYLPIAPWFFVGVEALPMACDDVLRPKTIVPKAQVICVFTLAATGAMVLWVCVSLPPPHAGEGLTELATVLAPLNVGFQLMFKISAATATLFTLPATYATAFGFIWCYGKLIHAMATSRLLPRLLARATNVTSIPYMALLAGSAVSYALCVLVYCVPTINRHLYPICIMSGFVAYTGQCIGYISLKKNYRNIKSSHFTNPFGIYGALFSIAVWLLNIIAIAGFQDDGQIEILAFLGIVTLLTIFYFSYAKRRQTFSPQENKVLLVAHVMKFNATRFSGKAKSRSKASRNTTASRHNNGPSSHAPTRGGGNSHRSEASQHTAASKPSLRYTDF
jgi:ethanolamine permease